MVTKIKSLSSKIGEISNFADDNILQKLFRFSLFTVAISIILTSLAFAAAPRTPSQALPKMFQKPTTMDYYEFKKREAIIPKPPEIQIKQEVEPGITITPDTLIILAPNILQNIIDLNKYKEKIVGRALTVDTL